MSSHQRYGFETFSAESDDFDRKFTDYLNEKYSNGFKYKSCMYDSVGNTTYARCLFKRT